MSEFIHWAFFMEISMAPFLREIARFIPFSREISLLVSHFGKITRNIPFSRKIA